MDGDGDRRPSDVLADLRGKEGEADSALGEAFGIIKVYSEAAQRILEAVNIVEQRSQASLERIDAKTAQDIGMLNAQIARAGQEIDKKSAEARQSIRNKLNSPALLFDLADRIADIIQRKGY